MMCSVCGGTDHTSASWYGTQSNHLKYGNRNTGGSSMSYGVNDSDAQYNKASRPKKADLIYKTSVGEEFWFEDDSYRTYGSGGHRPTAITNPPRLYKVLKQDGSSPMAGNMTWSLPTQNPDGTWTPGDWATVKGGSLVFCKRGLHAFDAKQYSNWLSSGQRLFEIEFDGPVAKQMDKYLGARARLVREIPSSVIANAYTVLSGKKMSKETFVSNALYTLRLKLRNEFDAHVGERAIDRATGLGADLQKQAKEALAKGQSGWVSFVGRIDDALMAAGRLVDNYTAIHKVLPVPAGTSAAAKEQHETLKKMRAAVPTLTWTRTDEPWNGGAVTFAEVELVGSTWWRDYSKRADAEITAAKATAEAEYGAQKTPSNFDELVDQSMGQEIKAKPAPRKRTIPGTLAHVQATAPKTRRGR